MKSGKQQTTGTTALQVTQASEDPKPASFLDREYSGITVRGWIQIISALSILYVFLGVLFYLLLVISERIREDEYLLLPASFYGDFRRNPYPSVPDDGDYFIAPWVCNGLSASSFGSCDPANMCLSAMTNGAYNPACTAP